MLYSIKELQDIFVDACVRDTNGDLMFLSAYGRDGSLQQLLASLHLGVHEGGLRSITLVGDPQPIPVSIGDPKRLTKFSGRLPKENLFGNLVQVWIYDPAILKPSRAARSGWILRQTNNLTDSNIREHVWALYRQIATVPLLSHWRDAVLDATRASVTDLAETSYAPCGRLSAWKLTLPDDLPQRISGLVKAGRLQLGDSASPVSARAI